MTQFVIFEEKNTASGKRIGYIRLNKESSLNAISLEMVVSLKDQLDLWRDNEDIVCLFMEGAGEKAFCAGGDVQALYQSAIENPGQPCLHAEEFFNCEYRLDYLLHTYPKPVICWGNGIVMGGGLGLMAGCSHAIVTERTRVAMPEITIGLYPDVGGSWFLNRMPGHAGLFLALTGASINGNDCLFAGLSKYGIASKNREPMLLALSQLNWGDTRVQNDALIDTMLSDFAQQSQAGMPAGNIEPLMAQIDALCDSGNAKTLIKNIMSLETENRWLIKARNSLATGSPLSALIIHEQLQRAKSLSLAQIFQSEYLLSTNIMRYPEFAEGVRALLIDKDRNPQWQFKTIDEVPGDLLEQLFKAPQSGSTWPVNPLQDLDQQTAAQPV